MVFHVVEVIVSISMAVFVGFYLFYLAVCVRYQKTKYNVTSVSAVSGDPPYVSIIVPTCNEAQVIKRKMENLRELRYPRDKFEIVFVDGGSTDGTVELIECMSKNSNLTIKIVRQLRRKGFNRAVIDGFAETTGDMICVTGAETEYDPDALNAMITHFKDPKIGAVTGRQEIKNVKDGYSPRLEVSYRRLYDLVRQAESNLDSPFDIKGEISAARRSVFAHIVEKPELSDKGAMDTCISFQAKIDGYRTIYEPNAVYRELSPKSIRESFKQQIRRAATLIENMMAFKFMIFNRRFGAFGLLIMPAHFVMLIVLPFVMLFTSIGLLVAVALNPLSYLLPIFVVALLATLLFSRVQAFLKTQLALTIAVLGLVSGIETQKFEQLPSTRA